MFDLGDAPDLTWIPRDAGGNGVDVGAAVLTLTLPDGSILTPAVTHIGAGLGYKPTSDFVLTQPGRHLVAWVGTGVNAQAYDDVFEVLAADEGLIISLADAKKGLGLRGPAAVSIDDDDLRGTIAAATGPMEDICGPILPRACDEWHDGGSVSIRLLQAPVLAVTTVLEAYGAGYTRALTLQNLDSGSFDAFGYTVDLADGLVQRRTAGKASPFVVGRRNIHVVYTAGRKPIPANIQRATRRLVRWLWQTEVQGQRPTGQGETLVVTESGFAVPRAVVQLCAAEQRLPGIA